MAFQVSPGVNVSEVDLTTSVPAVSVSTGAIAGAFGWGPALVPTLVSSEVDLVKQFGKPDNSTAGSFFTAANFLAYSNDLRVVRLQAQGATTAGAYPANTVTFTDSGDLVTLSTHGMSNGTPIVFTTVATTTGISVDAVYYVANAATNTFQVAAAPGGAALALTTDGTGAVVRPTAIQNDNQYINSYPNGISNAGPWVAKHIGSLGNSLEVVSFTPNTWAATITTSALASVNTVSITAASIGVMSYIGSNTGPYANGDQIVISSATPSAYNGTYYIKNDAGSLKLYTDSALSTPLISTAFGAWSNGTFTPTVSGLYQFTSQFDYAPATSPFVSSKTGLSNANDEIHIAVIDRTGLITGTPNTVIEKYQSCSVISDAKTPNGTANYYKEVVNRSSIWVRWAGHTQANVVNWGNTTTQLVTNGLAIGSDHSTPANNSVLRAGFDGTVLTGNTTDAVSILSNVELVDISLLMMGDASGNTTATGYSTVANTVLQTADGRKDCVAFVSPPLATVQGTSGVADAIATYGKNFYSTSYGVMDSGWKYQYDKYNDLYRWVPLNGDIAGLCAQTDNTRDPWWSPAGLQRGVIKNVVKLAYNPSKAERDTLYKAAVNPVVSFPGEGTLLFGDKTLQNRPSAFDHINVRRLFIVLEKAISRAARSSLFEFNDTFTRAQFVSLVEPFLRTVKARRGVYDYKVVCDDTNNTPQIIDSNQFVGDIYIKPARSINYIQLNFVAVRTGVSFNEVVGKF